MRTIPRRIIEAALKEARLNYTDRITDEMGPPEEFGILLADVGEALAFTFALGAVVEHSSRANDYVASMASSGRIAQPRGETILHFPGWTLEG